MPARVTGQALATPSAPGNQASECGNKAGRASRRTDWRPTIGRRALAENISADLLAKTQSPERRCRACRFVPLRGRAVVVRQFRHLSDAPCERGNPHLFFWILSPRASPLAVAPCGGAL